MMSVQVVLAEVPVCHGALLDDTDLKTREDLVAYNAAGLDLVWNFVTKAGAQTQTAVTPTTGGGDYDWTNQGNGLYSIGIPASGGASINNDTEGYGWFTGYATGVMPWTGPVIRFGDLSVEIAGMAVTAQRSSGELPGSGMTRGQSRLPPGGRY